MGRSQETFSKKEREKNKQKKRREKEEKKQQRKAHGKKSGSLEDMMAYVDEYGRITSTPPDQRNKTVVNAEDVQIGIPRNRDEEPADTLHTGKVTYFNEAKGYGFIRDAKTQESIFVHSKALSAPIKENDKVTFEVEKTPRGKSATNVRKDS